MRSSRDRKRARSGEHGAVLTETLIVFPPVFFLFIGLIQLVEMQAAGLLVRRAAGAAVRAAVVVLPDNDDFYDCDKAPSIGEGNSVPGGADACLFADVVDAARIVLRAGQGFRMDRGANPSVTLSGAFSGHNPVTARVSASYHCFVPPLGFVCGFDTKVNLSAEATLPYQGADYTY